MADHHKSVGEKITSFRRKYYLNIFLRGSILSVSILAGYFLLAAILEYNLWMSSSMRLGLFILFFGIAGYCIMHFLKAPLAWWLAGRGISEEDSARIIGRNMSQIEDRLLNYLQLERNVQAGSLVHASLNQKAGTFSQVQFDTIIDLGENRRYLKFLAVPVVLAFAILLFNQRILTQSASRIIQFNREFAPEAPFTFNLDNRSLTTYPNEDFILTVTLEGEALPESSYLVMVGRRVKMESLGVGKFSYTFEKVQEDIHFQLDAAGYFSAAYDLRVVNRPELVQLNVGLQFPRYLGRPSENLRNAGHLEVPEGTQVTWRASADFTEKATIQLSDVKSPSDMQKSDNQVFTYSRRVLAPVDYRIGLMNQNGQNKDMIAYHIEVIKDQHPSVVVDHLSDSVSYKNVLIAGNAQDDYGISRIEVKYELIRSANGSKIEMGQIPLVIERPGNRQTFVHSWSLDSLKMASGDKLQYYVEVWDNDGVNGAKSSKSAMYQLAVPDAESFQENIRRSEAGTESQFEEGLTKARTLKENIEMAEQKLKSKQALDWQDKKMLEEIIEQKKELDKVIRDLQEKNKALEQKKSAFNEQSQKIKEKAEQIQKLMNELMDEETRKLFEELEKMLKENQDPNQLQKLLEQMDRKELNVERELERTLELWKQLKFESKLETLTQNLNNQLNKQEELLKETDKATDPKDGNKDGQKAGEKEKENKENAEKGEKNSDKNTDSEKQGGKNEAGEEEESTADQNQEEKSLAEKQEELTEESKNLQKDMEELEKLGDELKNPESTPDSKQAGQINEDQQKSLEQLKQDKPGNSKEPQKNAIGRMKQLKQQLESAQNTMEMEMDMQNMENLRQILHGLIKLSYDQESNLRDFNSVQQSDPRIVQISQRQLKIQEDAKVLEDSLLALAKKDPFIGSVVTRELGTLDDHLSKSIELIRERDPRRKSTAGAELQLAMSSINNLALMLNDHHEMMMDMMKNAQSRPGKGKSKGKKNLGQMQMQINQEIQQLKNSGKSGRELSEEMARLAAEQERIRRALSEMQEKLKQEGGKPLGNDLPGKMEQTEFDLVNKQITEQTIRRQNDILTRLLESEKSMREQDMDDERKGETAKDYEKQIPKAFEDYLRLKEKEVELLKTVPPKLYPYYKKEVNEYFRRLGTNK